MSMTYLHTPNAEPVIERLADSLATPLRDGKRVLWLIPGGSAIETAVEVSHVLVKHQVPLEHLVVTLTDERYGPLDHDNENYAQLVRTGFIVPGATMYRILQDTPRADVAKDFDAFLTSALRDADVAIGFFGIGPDGHTAGIKPHTFDMTTPQLAIDYTGEDYERVTMTPAAIAKLDEAIAYANGGEKHDALDTLVHDDSVTVDDQPAQALKRAGTFTLFSDQTL